METVFWWNGHCSHWIFSSVAISLENCLHFHHNQFISLAASQWDKCILSTSIKYKILICFYTFCENLKLCYPELPKLLAREMMSNILGHPVYIIIIIIMSCHPARISLTLSRHLSLLFIASGRSSGLHPVSSHSCYMYVRAGHPAFAWPYAGVHRSTSLMSLSLLLQQCPACLVRLTWIVFVMGGKWLYSWCLVGCCCQDLFNIALNILV